MMSLVELRRLFAEWRIKLRRIQEVVQPPPWSTEEWNHFARLIVGVTTKYGRTWTQDSVTYWDLRWDLQEGGQLVCQFEQKAGEKKSLVVAQYGGFADGTENYIWFYAEFNDQGGFIGDAYWVEGSWKDALAMILMPHKMAAGFYLADAGAPIQAALGWQGPEGGTTTAPEEPKVASIAA
jgi:hypothetical protein